MEFLNNCNDLFTKEEWEWTNTENLEDSEVPDDATDLNSYTTEDVRNTLEPFLKGNENCDPILHYDYEWIFALEISNWAQM
ncbi:17441_t:CDS:2 [Entrophospora sp. SA101]|nr:17441_t:CDS:2 [Entrophospora sp. SA101]